MERNVRQRGGSGRGGTWRRGGAGGGGGGGSDTGTSGEHRGRGRGGHHRGRGKGDHYRGRGRSAPLAADFRRGQNEANDKQEEDFEDEGPNIFSRRKLESNWDRYESSEKEELNKDVPTQRGTDYHVLLSSAGDSFTQFRFSEEKDWEMDSLAANQMSAVFVDLPALAQALQELPLHQRLNLEAELVQVTTPVELPSMTVTSKPDLGVIGGFKPPVPVQNGLGPGRGVSCPVKPVSGSTASRVTSGAVQPPSDDADEELDLLLHLQKPVTELSLAESPPDNTVRAEMPSPDQSSHETAAEVAGDPEVKAEEAVPTAQPGKQEVTEEDLEDWLDSMIS